VSQKKGGEAVRELRSKKRVVVRDTSTGIVDSSLREAEKRQDAPIKGREGRENPKGESSIF